MWQKKSSKILIEHPRLTLIEDEVVLPNGKETTYLHYAVNGDAATIITQREDGKILLQKEYSYPPNKRMYQFPGGLIPKGEDKAEGANRELMEEAKLYANDLKLLGTYYVNNRRSTEKMYIYLARELEERALKQDAEEEFEDFWYTEKEIEDLMKKGEIENVHAYATWTFYKLNKEK